MIENALYSLLVAASTDAEDRVYPLFLPQDGRLPAVTYQRISGVRELDHSGDQGYADARVQLNCFAQDTTVAPGFDQARDLAEQCRLALSGYRGTVAGVDVGRIQITGDRHDWDPDRTYQRVVLDALCSFQEAKP